MLKEWPICFDAAQSIFNKVLNKGYLLIRTVVYRPRRGQYSGGKWGEIAEINIFSLEKIDSIKPGLIFTRIEFRVEIFRRMNKVGFLDSAIYVDGPTRDLAPVAEGYVIDQLGLIISDWHRNEMIMSGQKQCQWIDNNTSQFIGYLNLSGNLRICAPPCHPMIFPYISICLGNLYGTLDKKLALVTNNCSIKEAVDSRKSAVHSLLSRFESFVIQTQRKTIRQNLGPFGERESASMYLLNLP